MYFIYLLYNLKPMRNLFFLCLVIFSTVPLAYAQKDSAISKPLHCMKDFRRSGWTIDHYMPNNVQVNLHLAKAEKHFRASQGLLAGGIASALIGSGAVVAGTLGNYQSKALRPYSTPLIISGAALNIAVMPVCFVLRDVMIKKATKHINDALALTP